MSICRYCGRDLKLCKAHIIPESFYTELNLGDYMILAKGEYVKRSKMGDYDNTILCAECDGIIGKLDNIAKQLLLENVEKFKREDAPIYIALPPNYDYENMKKFFISLIWRASITDRGLFDVVDLGEYEDLALKMLKGEIQIEDGFFDVIVFKYTENLHFRNCVAVHKGKWSGAIHYRFLFAGYLITIFPNTKQFRRESKNSIIVNIFINRNEFAIMETDVDLGKAGKMFEYCIKNYDREKKYLK